jgi:peptidoglycan/xylan/chitin deacetylase (PgdA/CDA1 family)
MTVQHQVLDVPRGRIVLMLHDVVPDGADPDVTGFPGPASASYKLFRRRFSRLMDAVAVSGRPVELTFDDGGLSAAAVGADLIERGWRGTFFITTERIGTPGFLSANGVRELRDAGHLVGSHSHTHAVLKSLPPAELGVEWRRSRAILEDILAEPVTVASVPNGQVNRRVCEAAAAAGYQQLHLSKPSTRHHRANGLWQVGRFPVRAAHDDSFLFRLISGERLPQVTEYSRWLALDAGKHALGPGYHTVRRLLMSMHRARA